MTGNLSWADPRLGESVLQVLQQLPSAATRRAAQERVTQVTRGRDDTLAPAEYEQVMAAVTRAMQEKEPPP